MQSLWEFHIFINLKEEANIVSLIDQSHPNGVTMKINLSEGNVSVRISSVYQFFSLPHLFCPSRLVSPFYRVNTFASFFNRCTIEYLHKFRPLTQNFIFMVLFPLLLFLFFLWFSVIIFVVSVFLKYIFLLLAIWIFVIISIHVIAILHFGYVIANFDSAF